MLSRIEAVTANSTADKLSVGPSRHAVTYLRLLQSILGQEHSELRFHHGFSRDWHLLQRRRSGILHGLPHLDVSICQNGRGVR